MSVFRLCKIPGWVSYQAVRVTAQYWHEICYSTLPDAVEAAACQAHKTQTVVDERKNPQHYLQPLESYSYNTHLSATAVPTLRVGRPGLVRGGNRASGLAPEFCRRGAWGFRSGSGGGIWKCL